MRSAAIALVLSLLPGLVVSKEPTFLGATRADPRIVNTLSLGVVGAVSGDCAQIDSIRIAEIPSDFVPSADYKAFSFELWTAIGCSIELPVWVGWDRTATIEVFGRYRAR